MACTEAFALTPTTTLRATLNFTAAQNPYVNAWYLDQRSSGSETITDFLLRKSVEAALDHRGQTLISACATEQRTTRETSQADEATYARTTRAAQETERGSIT